MLTVIKSKHTSHFGFSLRMLLIVMVMTMDHLYAQEQDEYEGYVKVPKTIVHFGIEYPIIAKTVGYLNQNVKLEQGVSFAIGTEFKIAKLQYLNCTLSYYSDNLTQQGIYENEILTQWQSFILGVDYKKLLRKPSDFFVPYGFAGVGVDINSQEYDANNKIKNVRTSIINKSANGFILRLGTGAQYSNNYLTIETDIRLHFSFFELSRRNKDYYSLIYGLRLGYNL